MADAAGRWPQGPEKALLLDRWRLSAAMDLRFHTYRGDVDYRRIRELLIACRAGSTGCECWGLDRWEGVRYHGHIQAELVGNHDWYQAIGLWEERDGRLVAALIPESPGEVYPQVLPELRADRSLPDEMLRFAEDYRRAECPAAPLTPGSTSMLPRATWR